MHYTALVVPSIREESLRRFIKEWEAVGLFDSPCLHALVIIEDNPERSFDVHGMFRKKIRAGLELHHFSWREIDEMLGEKAWIIPRRSDTVRSFGYWWVWQDAGGMAHSAGPTYDYLMTLDDDCYPAKGYEKLEELHVSMLEDRTRWFSTLNSVRPRGIPYKNVGKRSVMVNHGIWQGVLDYDAPQQLVNPVPETYTHDNRIVPHGAYFPFCGMNWMCHRDAIPLMYHLLMGRMWASGSPPISEKNLERLPFDRFGDIWCGILTKKVCDHLGWAVSSGTPYIHHDRASDPFKNLVKEAAGIGANEWFWEEVDKIFLSGKDPVDCYWQLGLTISGWDGEHQTYWAQLGRAMRIWAEMFRKQPGV